MKSAAALLSVVSAAATPCSCRCACTEQACACACTALGFLPSASCAIRLCACSYGSPCAERVRRRSRSARTCSCRGTSQQYSSPYTSCGRHSPTFWVSAGRYLRVVLRLADADSGSESSLCVGSSRAVRVDAAAVCVSLTGGDTETELLQHRRQFVESYAASHFGAVPRKGAWARNFPHLAASSGLWRWTR